MYNLKLKHHFAGAHRLNNYDGACANLHGHNWVVEVEIISETLFNDMVVDFKQLKKIIDKLDHAYLNDVVPFNPTAENLAKYLHDQIKTDLTKVKITIWESPDASITYES